MLTKPSHAAKAIASSIAVALAANVTLVVGAVYGSTIIVYYGIGGLLFLFSGYELQPPPWDQLPGACALIVLALLGHSAAYEWSGKSERIALLVAAAIVAAWFIIEGIVA
jgi:Ca2+/Na+ antiporter